MISKTMSGTFTKAVGGPEGIVEAIVNTTNVLDSQGDIITLGAWLGAIGTPERVRVSRDHNHTAAGIIGRTLALKELLPGDPRIPEDLAARGAGVLYAKAQLNLSKPAGREAFDDLAGGFVAEWSVAFDVADGGEERVQNVRYIRKVRDLYEYSAVFRGAAPGTRTMIAKCDQCNPGVRKKVSKKDRFRAEMAAYAKTYAEAEAAMQAFERRRQATRHKVCASQNGSFPEAWHAFGTPGRYAPPATAKSEAPLGRVTYYVSPELSKVDPNWQPAPGPPPYDPRMR